MNSSNSKSWEVYPRSRNLYTTDVIINSHFQLLPSQKGSPQWVTPQVWLAEFYALFMASLIQPQRGFVYLAGIKPAQLLPSGETIFQDHKLPFLIKRKNKRKSRQFVEVFIQLCGIKVDTQTTTGLKEGLLGLKVWILWMDQTNQNQTVLASEFNAL